MNEFKGSQNYVASEELLRAANIAMVLQKPLLIKIYEKFFAGQFNNAPVCGILASISVKVRIPV